jgi:hypothetical protein
MTDAIQKAKSKSPYVDRLNPRYAVTPGAEEKRRQAAALRFFERGYRG